MTGNSDSSLPYDIAVVGLGIAGTHQISREVEHALSRANHVFVLNSAPGVLQYIQGICPKVTDLLAQYELGAYRRKIYQRMASSVVAAALEEGPVCFATSGHPKLYCHPTTLIQRAAKLLDLKVEVLPGISSIDTLLIDLNLDPGFDGLQIYDATDIIVRRRPLQNDVSCIIMQAPIVLEPQSRNEASRPANLQKLQDYLLQFYPEKHEAVLLVSKTHPLVESVTQAVPLGRLATALQRFSTLTTLYIPPVHHRKAEDHELAKSLEMPEADSALHGKRPGRPDIGPKSA